MDHEFRSDVKDVGKLGVNVLKNLLNGAPVPDNKLRAGMFAVGQAVKVSHMDQLKEHGDKSLALRLFQFLPKDEDVRKKYLQITNPELKPLLLDRPKTKR